MKTFYKTDHFDIEKINIVEIAKALGIFQKKLLEEKFLNLKKLVLLKKKVNI